MSNELQQLINDFDIGFDEILKEDELYIEYNHLQQKIANDSALITLVEAQKKLQKEVMNLTYLRQDEFINFKKKDLDKVDMAIDIHEDLNDLKQIIYQLEIEQNYVKNKINKWKEANGFKK